MALPFSPVTKAPSKSVEVHPGPFEVKPQAQQHAPNFTRQVGDALLVSALTALPDALKGVELREGTYVLSDANIIEETFTPEGNLVIVFSQREGGALGYVFSGGAEIMAIAEAAEAIAEVAGEALI